MTWTVDDTIAAVASAAGSARRGLIRISGVDVHDAIAVGFQSTQDWKAIRRPTGIPGTWNLDQSGLSVCCRLHFWPNRRSFTGEPLAELHLPGSPPLLNQICGQLFAKGVRPAEPGEFTLRAFLAGRIDLVEAEAVLGVIDAAEEGELRTALGQLAGTASNRLAEVQEDLLLLLADLEAGLDFVEEDIEFVPHSEIVRRVESAIETLQNLQVERSARSAGDDLPVVVIAGLPNAGKSTLTNWLVGKPVAIVSDVRGTTRDVVSAVITQGSIPFEIRDTAGWEQLDSGIDQIAARLRNEAIETADLLIWCRGVDASPAESERDSELFRHVKGQRTRPILRLATKSEAAAPTLGFDLTCGAEADIGRDELLATICSSLATTHAGDRVFIGSTLLRCGESLRGCLSALQHSHSLTQTGAGDELIAMELRSAVDHLSVILGKVHTDDILDRVFSRFCIGK